MHGCMDVCARYHAVCSIAFRACMCVNNRCTWGVCKCKSASSVCALFLQFFNPLSHAYVQYFLFPMIISLMGVALLWDDWSKIAKVYDFKAVASTAVNGRDKHDWEPGVVPICTQTRKHTHSHTLHTMHHVLLLHDRWVMHSVHIWIMIYVDRVEFLCPM